MRELERIQNGHSNTSGTCKFQRVHGGIRLIVETPKGLSITLDFVRPGEFSEFVDMCTQAALLPDPEEGAEPVSVPPRRP